MHYSFKRVALHRFLIQYLFRCDQFVLSFRLSHSQAITFFPLPMKISRDFDSFTILFASHDNWFFYWIGSIIEGEKKRRLLNARHFAVKFSAEKTACVVCCLLHWLTGNLPLNCVINLTVKKDLASINFVLLPAIRDGKRLFGWTAGQGKQQLSIFHRS